MATTLSLFCDRLIEAGWLVALIVTPLFFNVYSSRTFEPDKLTILHAIALLMALAWMIKGLERWGARARAAGQQQHRAHHLSPRRVVVAYPLPCLGLLWLAVSAFATVTSVAPRLSLWGSYERLQGLFTTSAYVVVFLSLVALLRRREQLERLLTTVLVVSVPVSLYGILQHFGTDPVPWGGDVSRRVTSTMGNPIFVAAFLMMSVPLTLYRHLEVGRRIAEHESGGTKAVLSIGSCLYVLLQMAAWWLGPTAGSLAAATTISIWIVEASLLGKPLLPCLRLGSYSVLLSTQLTCLLLSQSRGPWLGLLAGVWCFGLCGPWSGASGTGSGS